MRVTAVLPRAGLVLGAVAATVGCAEPAGETSPAWDLEPILRIGSLDAPGQSLTLVGRVAEDSRGRLFVLQPQEGLVRVFGADGTFEREIGRPGSGPGEFQHPVNLGIRNDTLWVIDGRLNQLSVFTPDGEHLSSSLLPRSEYRDRFPIHVVDWMADGSLLGSLGFSGHEVAEGELTRQLYFRMSPEGEIEDTLAGLPPDNVLLRIRSPGEGNPVAGLYASQPISDAPLLSLDARRKMIMVVTRGVRDVRSTMTYGVRLLDTRGETLASFERPYEPTPFPEELRDSLIDAWTATAMESRGAGFRSHREARAEVEKQLFLPTVLPPVGAALLAEDGTVWLKREKGLRPVSPYDVLSVEGELLGRVETDQERILLVRRDHVWAITHDALGVPYLSKLRVRRGGSDGGNRSR